MDYFDKENEFSSQVDTENGKTFSEYWQMLLKHWKLFIILTLVFFVAGLTYAELYKSAEYEASGTCMILTDQSGDDEITSDEVSYSLILLATIKTFMTDEPVIEAVTEDLNSQNFSVTTTQVKSMLSVEAEDWTTTSKSLYLNISGTSSNEELATAVVNSCLNQSIYI